MFVWFRFESCGIVDAMNENSEDASYSLTPLPPGAHSEEALEAVLDDDRPVVLRSRRKWLPVVLFLITCVTTFAAGCYHWDRRMLLGNPVVAEIPAGDTYHDYIGTRKTAQRDTLDLVPWWEGVRRHWQDGLVYMVCVLAILLFHEMGHFLMTLRYKVPASFPFFIPTPFMITGTMGAVIGMDPKRADRKAVFDIGIAGPLAGLVVTIPLVIIGLAQAKSMVVPEEPSNMGFGDPILVKLLIPLLHDTDSLERKVAAKDAEAQMNPLTKDRKHRYTFQINAIYMAAWVGMLITGLNMLPMSQLDGGHVVYGLFGKGAWWLARAFLVAAIAFIIITNAFEWSLMIVLIVLIGTDHPPTADDTVPLGRGRWILGLLSLSIPILCFTPFPFTDY